MWFRLGLTAAAVALVAAGAAAQTGAQVKTATFAGGCFWCMEAPFDKLPGVTEVTVGYTGGTRDKPTYHEVSAGTTGHAEAVQVTYDPARIGYAKLLDVFWHNVDPVTANAQFCDHGTQYRTAIFYHDDEQKHAAEASRDAIAQSGRLHKPIVTEITQATAFWPAEDYHQHYYVKNPVRYKFYRYNCGRDQRLEQLWGPEYTSSEAGH
ncbi:MAG: peptide-methionine (S)-S-oxide reductase MsrA [Xanthobacteraceae bacterium]|jgi:peptide-methionine (S)-S-oxide reductase